MTEPYITGSAFDPQKPMLVNIDPDPEAMFKVPDPPFPPAAKPAPVPVPAPAQAPVAAQAAPATVTPRRRAKDTAASVPRPDPQVVQILEKKADVSPAEANGPSAADVLAAAFDALVMPFLTPSPSKPGMSVYMNMGEAGNMMARYHAVVPGAGCLILVYDTRYTDGVQWSPADTGTRKMDLWYRKDGQEKQGPIAVMSCGFMFSLGCLECVILLRGDRDVSPKEGE